MTREAVPDCPRSDATNKPKCGSPVPWIDCPLDVLCWLSQPHGRSRVRRVVTCYEVVAELWRPGARNRGVEPMRLVLGACR